MLRVLVGLASIRSRFLARRGRPIAFRSDRVFRTKGIARSEADQDRAGGSALTGGSFSLGRQMTEAKAERIKASAIKPKA